MHANARPHVLHGESLFVCPSCRSPLRSMETGWYCEHEQLGFSMTEDIPDFILPSRRPDVERFLTLYQSVRKVEGWSINKHDTLLTLPYSGADTRFKNIWRVRARSFELFLHRLNGRANRTSLTILDLGAGNCWMAYRLAEGAQQVVAVDVNLDPFDGLGVPSAILKKTEQSVLRIRAEYDFLPFPERSFDVAYFNASLHYAPDPVQTILKTLSLLKEGGSLFVLDSPLYRDPESGKSMVKERQEEYRKRYNIELPDELAGGFLTHDDIERLRRRCSVEIIHPEYDFPWNLRPIVARLLGRREPATFALLHIQP